MSIFHESTSQGDEVCQYVMVPGGDTRHCAPSADQLICYSPSCVLVRSEKVCGMRGREEC